MIATIARLSLAGLLFLAPALAEAAEWVEVEITIDMAAGTVSGDATAPDGGMMLIRLKRPPLDASPDPMDGYIGPDSALLPIASGWLPPLPAGAAGWRISATTPPGFLAAPFPGGSVERADDGSGHTAFELPAVAARAPLVVGRFRLAERTVGDVTLRTFFTDANAAHAESYLEAAAASIAILEARIGPYPYPAFSVVESPLPVGLGFPGYTLVSGRILPLPFMRGRSLRHEISHVWWGNGVLVDYESGNWAEAFATFFADYGMAEEAGAEAARDMRYDWLLEYDALSPDADSTLRRFVTKSHGGAQSIGYGKGAMLLHMLRRKIGAAAFDAGIRRFWRDNRFKRAGWGDIQAAFAAETGEDLGPFFQRWLDEPGAAAADAADRDFHVFRDLAPEERIATLRGAFAAKRFAVEVRPGAPVSTEQAEAAVAMIGVVAKDGAPFVIGPASDRPDAEGYAPPDNPVASIWAMTDADGREGVSLALANETLLRPLLGRARHYGRWSWLAVGADGRPARGRWRPGLSP